MLYSLGFDRRICQFLFLFGRVVDEVEALKAILMDELIVRTNERLAFSMYLHVPQFVDFIWLLLTLANHTPQDNTLCVNVLENVAFVSRIYAYYKNVCIVIYRFRFIFRKVISQPSYMLFQICMPYRQE